MPILDAIVSLHRLTEHTPTGRRPCGAIYPRTGDVIQWKIVLRVQSWHVTVAVETSVRSHPLAGTGGPCTSAAMCRYLGR